MSSEMQRRIKMISKTSRRREGNTLFVVMDPESYNDKLNRECNRCKGLGHIPGTGDYWDVDCPNCHGTKRHTFSIVVDRSTPLWRRSAQLYVHIHDVLLIYTGLAVDAPLVRFAWIDRTGGFSIYPDGMDLGKPPADAESGKYLVIFKIHEGD